MESAPPKPHPLLKLLLRTSALLLALALLFVLTIWTLSFAFPHTALGGKAWHAQMLLAQRYQLLRGNHDVARSQGLLGLMHAYNTAARVVAPARPQDILMRAEVWFWPVNAAGEPMAVVEYPDIPSEWDLSISGESFQDFSIPLTWPLPDYAVGMVRTRPSRVEPSLLTFDPFRANPPGKHWSTPEDAHYGELARTLLIPVTRVFYLTGRLPDSYAQAFAALQLRPIASRIDRLHQDYGRIELRRDDARHIVELSLPDLDPPRTYRWEPTTPSVLTIRPLAATDTPLDGPIWQHLSADSLGNLGPYTDEPYFSAH